MNRQEIETWVRKMVRSGNIQMSVYYTNPLTTIYLYADINDSHYAVKSDTRCDPDDKWDARVGYEIAFERGVKKLVDDIMADQKPEKATTRRTIKARAGFLMKESVEMPPYGTPVEISWDVPGPKPEQPIITTHSYGYESGHFRINHRYALAGVVAAIKAVGDSTD